MQTTKATTTTYELQPSVVHRLLTKRSFAVLSTTSRAGNAHAAGVLYALIDGDFYINTLRSSRKARNIAEQGGAALCIPVRRLPVGPPSSIQFQATAQLLALGDGHMQQLIDAGKLKALTSHGELEEPDGCFLRLTPGPKMFTYGLGMSLRRLIRDPLHAAGEVVF